MISFRNFIVFLMFSAFLVGCSTPFIDIDVKHSSGGGQPSGGATCPAWAAALGWCVPSQGASIPLAGKVDEVLPFTGEIYKITTADGKKRELYSPPFTVKEGDPKPEPGNDVSISFINGEIDVITTP